MSESPKPKGSEQAPAGEAMPKRRGRGNFVYVKEEGVTTQVTEKKVVEEGRPKRKGRGPFTYSRKVGGSAAAEQRQGKPVPRKNLEKEDDDFAHSDYSDESEDEEPAHGSGKK